MIADSCVQGCPQSAGEPAERDRDLIKRASSLSPGTSVKLGILRKDQEMTIDVTIAELPNPRANAPTRPEKSEAPAAGNDAASIGLTLVPADRAFRP